ncbi:MAG: hypothetical protein NC205_00765 [Prevotella sp.]|nr:hypothetical protein [Alistipes senegalensis]MCM1357094.1 hypothetical protein [Prevotella sp.]MCM1472584.1 hypothetical protein [Muribaculaceae bacterium]
MKKYLSIIFVLLTLTAFASCGDSSSIAETPEVSESIVVLDSVFENSYLKIAVDDDWEKHTKLLDGTYYIYWSWEDENSSQHEITLDITKNDSGKMSLEDFKSAYDTDFYVHINGLRLFNENKYQLEDIFEVNNQAYLVTGNRRTHCMFFKTDDIAGNFVYSISPRNDEEIVMDMINSIEFKSFVKQTETKPIKTIKKVSKTTTEKVAEPIKELITEPPTEKIPETQPPVIETTPVQIALHFVLNLDTNCIHINPECSAALKILPENYSTVDITEDDLANYNGTYWACGKCSHGYTGILPKF